MTSSEKIFWLLAYSNIREGDLSSPLDLGAKIRCAEQATWELESFKLTANKLMEELTAEDTSRNSIRYKTFSILSEILGEDE